jgi:hypothetical protein
MAEPRDTARVFAVPRVMFGVLIIAAGWYGARQRHRSANGTVIVDGAPITIDACKKVPVAGADCIGADLLSSHRNVLRLVQDEHGVQLWFYPEGSNVAIPIDRRDCSEWKISFFSGTADPLAPIGGDANFTCAVGGRKIDGLAFFEHCRP